jgi:hypothetical protein
MHPRTINLLEEVHPSKLDDWEIPSRLDCSSLRPEREREKNPAQKEHALTTYEDRTDSAAPSQEPADFSTPDSALLDKVILGSIEHSRPDLNRQPQECPTAPNRGRAGACGEEKPLPDNLTGRIPLEDRLQTTRPKLLPIPPSTGEKIDRMIWLVDKKDGSSTCQEITPTTHRPQKSNPIMGRKFRSCNQNRQIQVDSTVDAAARSVGLNKTP